MTDAKTDPVAPVGGSNFYPVGTKWVDIHSLDGTVTRISGDSCLVVTITKTPTEADGFVNSILNLADGQPPIITVHTDNLASTVLMLGGAIATVNNMSSRLVEAAILYAAGLEFQDTDSDSLQDTLNNQKDTD